MNNPPDDAAKRIARAARSERALLGALMHAGADLDAILPRVAPADFMSDAHQTVAQAVRDLWAEHRPVELVTVADRLRKTGRLARLAPSEAAAEVWLAELFADAGTGAMADYHAGEVVDAARTRALAQAATEILRDCQSPTGPAAELIDRAAARVFALADRGRSASRLRTSAEATNDAMDEYDRKARGETPPGVMTGLADLDRMTGGLSFGQLTILAARPSVGKTALAHQIARHAAGNGQPVLFASLEQRTAELGTRGIAAEGKVCGQSLRLGHKLVPQESARLPAALDRLRALPFHYDDTSGQTALHVLGTARGLKRKGGLALVVVDYLQLVSPDDPRASRNDQLDGITKRIRDLARELDVAVLALSQLSRDSEKQNRRPRLSDLRDSGAIEQHADAVLMLHRPERLPGEVDAVELGIEKQRNGPTGLVNLAYRRRVLSFENAAEDMIP